MKKETPNPLPALIDRLDAEAERFTQLAKENALKALLHHGNTEHAGVARQHLIRAETFRDAARLAANSQLLTPNS